MGGMSSREEAAERTRIYLKRMSEKAKTGNNIPPSDEKGKYHSWKYDYDNGIKFYGDRLKEFLRLKKKYGTSN